jgi:hypothetical protein
VITEITLRTSHPVKCDREQDRSYEGNRNIDRGKLRTSASTDGRSINIVNMHEYFIHLLLTNQFGPQFIANGRDTCVSEATGDGAMSEIEQELARLVIANAVGTLMRTSEFAMLLSRLSPSARQRRTPWMWFPLGWTILPGSKISIW